MENKFLKQKGKIIVICVIFLFGIIIGENINAHVFFTFDVNKGCKEDVVVYWSSANNEFNEAASKGVSKGIYPKNSVWIAIPRAEVDNIRIDLGSTPSKWEISNIQLIHGLCSSKLLDSNKINVLGYQNDIEQITINDNKVSVTTNGRDGHFILNNVTSGFVKENLGYKVLYWLAVLGFTCLIYIIVKFTFNIFTKQYSADTLYKKIVIAFILSIDAFLIACIWDTLILKSVYYLVQKSDLLISRYLSSIVDFSLARILFWFIFILAIIICIVIGFENSFHYRYVIASVVFIYLVIGQYHGSSIGFLSGMLTEHTDSYEKTTLLGINQGLRGDEWAVWTPFKIAQSKNAYKFYNDNLMIEGCDTMVGGKLPSYDMMSITRQKNWGYFFLPLENAVAFEWWISLFLIFLSGIDLMYELTGRKKISILYAVILVFSPCVQWWNSLWVIIYSGQYFLVALSRFLKSTQISSKIGFILLATISAISYIFDLYPAWMIPFAYIFLIIGIWIIWKNRKVGLLSKKNVFGYISVITVGAIFAIRFLYLSKDAMLTQMSTTYPGSGQWVTVPMDMPLLQIINFFMGFGSYSEYLNNCEISQFYGLFIWSLIILVFYLYKKKRTEGMHLVIGLTACSLFYLYFIYGPQIKILYKITLLSFSYPRRVYTAFGYCTLLILFLIINETIENGGLPVKYSKRISCLLTGIVLLLMIADEKIISYLQVSPVIGCLAVLLVECWGIIGYTVISVRKQRVGMFLWGGLTILSTICVNPINRGLDDFNQSTLIQEVQQIEKENEQGKRWMVDGNTTLANMISACGVKRTSGTYIYPDYSMMQIVDPDGIYENQWNRYAHINMELGEKNFVSVDESSASVVIDIDTAKKLDIGYIVMNKEISTERFDLVQFDKLYEDIDGWHIYEIIYEK